ncbi:condensin complex subunit 3 [Venturia canescens]|uniref:condensin complex subunit 3 n=1 Tax=Venturia canescens TaxID=32260 RepID=UPI001C9D2729|nr:condensin complex subunit 3 [Venturia canescens]
MPIDVVGIMHDAFTAVQYSKTSHQAQQKRLKKLYSKVDHDVFAEEYIKCLRVPLTVGKKHPHVENTLSFAVQFATSLYTPIENMSEHMCPFLMHIFDFILSHHTAKDLAVRFRLCHLLTMLLNAMGDDAFIEDSLCDRITSSMMERLLDRSPKVRAQAALALQRLQDPTDENCQVIRMYIFHLSKDPSSDVRKAILSAIAKNQKALPVVLKRTRDVDEGVRKMAYAFISKITVRSLTIKQREDLLNDGLKDRSEIVTKFVKNVLLPTWLLHFKENYLKLMRALDAETATETTKLALETLLKRDSLTKLLEQLPIDSETKLIPLDKLTSESVLYWCCLIEHLYREGCTDEVEHCLPELTKFCDYIRNFVTMIESKEYEPADLSTLKFILYQLFQIAKTYDLSDEIGRSNLNQLILDTLLSEQCSEKVVESLVLYLETVEPNVDSRLISLAHVISEIRLTTRQTVSTQISEEDERKNKYEVAKLKVKLNEIQEEEYDAIKNRNFLKAQELKEQIEQMQKEIDAKTSKINPVAIIENICEEKSDAKTMVKCLTIMGSAAAAKSVTTLTTTLRSLYDNMALPMIGNVNTAVHILALKAVAICCLLDEQLAEKHMMMYILQFTLDPDSQGVWVVCLQAIFDLLLQYGLDFFGIVQDDHDDSKEKNRRSGHVKLRNNTEDDMTGTSLRSDDNDNGSTKFVKMLIALLDNGDQELRTLTTEGLCKLLLHGRISGAQLISRLLILLYNPVSVDDVYLRQCLCNFFKMYVVRVPESQEMLEQAFMPTLKTLVNAPEMSPLQAIEPHHMAQIILSLTSSRNHKPGFESYDVHNNLAMAILAEALDPVSQIDQESLLKSLKYLDVRFEDNTLKNNVLEAVDKLEESLKETDKRLVRYIQQFKIKISEVNHPEETRENIEPVAEALSETETD